MSLAGSPAPYWPGRNSAIASPLTAVVTKTRPPQTIGDECARPEIGAFQWERGQYRAVGRVSFSVAAVTAHPLAGNDLILQAVSAKQKDKTEFEVHVTKPLEPGEYAFFMNNGGAPTQIWAFSLKTK